MEQVGVGFIGAGDVAWVHYRALSRIPRAKLVAVYDIDADKGRKLASEARARYCASAEELVTLADVDAVYVLTSLRAHYANAVLALRAAKHTFIEKPVSLAHDEIVTMIQLSEKKGVYCVPGHNYIHSPGLRSAKEMIEAGQLGDIYSLWVLFMLLLPMSICNRIPGVLREVMVHHFYSMLYLVGRPESLVAQNSDPRNLGPNREDQAVVTCKMPGGALAVLFGSFAVDDLSCDPWTVQYKILGSRGSASHSWSASRLADRPQPIWDLPAYWETFREENRYFIDECLFGGKAPLSSMEDALTCLDVLYTAEKSIQLGTAQRLAYTSYKTHSGGA